jgi:hypothetical protein
MTDVTVPPPRRSALDVLAAVVVLAFLVGGAGLRFWLARRGYHNDEIGMFDPAGVPSILFSTELASNPPLLQVLFAAFPNAWVLPAGRIASAAMGSLGVGYSAWMAWRRGGPWAAAVTAGGLALAIPHLTDTTMFRAYAWLCLLVPWLADVTATVLTRDARPSWTQVVGIAVLGGLCSWIHYLTVPFVLLAFLLVLWRHRSAGIAAVFGAALLTWAPFFRWFYLWSSSRPAVEGMTGTTRLASLDMATNQDAIVPIVVIVLSMVGALVLSWRREPETRVWLVGASLAWLMLVGMSTFMLVRSPIICVVLSLWAPAMASVAPGRAVAWLFRAVVLWVLWLPPWQHWEMVEEGGIWLGTARDLNAPKAMVARLDEIVATVGTACVYTEDMMIADLIRYEVDALLTEPMKTCGGCASDRCSVVKGVPFVWTSQPIPGEAWHLWDRRFDRVPPDTAHGCVEAIRDEHFLLSRCPAGLPIRGREDGSR